LLVECRLKYRFKDSIVKLDRSKMYRTRIESMTLYEWIGYDDNMKIGRGQGATRLHMKMNNSKARINTSIFHQTKKL
jgi:hypothetical protein